MQSSRCSSLDEIKLLSKARQNDFIGNKIPDSMIAAEARLDALSNSTIDNLDPWDWSEGTEQTRVEKLVRGLVTCITL